MPQGQICVYDFTCKCDRVASSDAVKTFLRKIAKKWTFQKELGTKTGFLHWQGRVSLRVKVRPKAALSLFNQEWEPGWGQLSITSGDEAAKMYLDGTAFYCQKDDTRQGGPWTDKDPVPQYETMEVQKLEKWGLRAWQMEICDLITGYDGRSINVVYCPKGNIGKSSFTEWLEFKDIAYEIPMMRLMEDIMQAVMNINISRKWSAFTIDMPRAMNKEKLYDFFSGIECLKNGVAYDKRYQFKKLRFNRPHIWIFTNDVPDVGMMSRDRWKIWQVYKDHLKTHAYVRDKDMNDQLYLLEINKDVIDVHEPAIVDVHTLW